VTGGVGGAAQGTLTLFVGGPEAWFEECREVLSAVSKLQTHFGPAGQGHVAKLINNMICIGNLAVFSEALPLAMAAGLELESIFKTLLSGTASSEMLKFYGPQIIARDFAPRFKLGHAAKDVDLAVELSKNLGVDLPVLEGVKNLFDDARAAGLSDQNLSAVISNIGRAFKPPLFNE
jgi:3-hydroxyisobutyrate dehydrogenase-like beta-hydroxyacid dehydrogenase